MVVGYCFVAEVAGPSLSFLSGRRFRSFVCLGRLSSHVSSVWGVRSGVRVSRSAVRLSIWGVELVWWLYRVKSAGPFVMILFKSDG